MRFLLPTLILASPALAHPIDMSQTPIAKWAVPLTLAFIATAVVLAKRKALRIRAHK